jgi:hypothetical protein
MNPYRQRIWTEIERALESIGPIESALDFGSGDGWFAHQMRSSNLASAVHPLDVKRRAHVFAEPQIYDGNRLPFHDGAFDLVYSVDVLHHCTNPLQQLDDLMRCTRRFLLLKDHTYETFLGRYALAVMDELGNRRFGIPSVYQYQHGKSWHLHLLKAGFVPIRFIHPMLCHTGVLGALTNSLQYLALYEKSPVLPE